MNLFIGKTMKQNNHIWQSLEIFGDDKDREFFTSFINDMLIGVETFSYSIFKLFLFFTGKYIWAIILYCRL